MNPTVDHRWYLHPEFLPLQPSDLSLPEAAAALRAVGVEPEVLRTFVAELAQSWQGHPAGSVVVLDFTHQARWVILDPGCRRAG